MTTPKFVEVKTEDLLATVKDAKRYRWLRECKGPVCAGVERDGYIAAEAGVQWLDTTDLDAAIDVALGQQHERRPRQVGVTTGRDRKNTRLVYNKGTKKIDIVRGNKGLVVGSFDPPE